LYDFFRGEVEELEAMLQRDFSSWKALEVSLSAGMRAAI
jgi:hypothetical protein